MMKICLLGDARSVHLQRLALGLASRDLHVHLVTHKPADILGVTVERFRVPPRGVTNLRRWGGRRQAYLRRLVERFDVVNVQFLSDWGLTPDLIQNGCIIATAWGSDIIPPPGEGQPSEALTDVRRCLLRHSAAITACGPTFASAVAMFAGLDRRRVDVVPFGVDLERFVPIVTTHPNGVGEVPPAGPAVGVKGSRSHRSCSSEPARALRVGFFKGFREVYGATDLIRAIPFVLRSLPFVRFELVGDGPQLAECRAMAVTLGVEAAIDWLPRQPHALIPRLLGRWDLTVIPSVSEAFGVAALESSAMGVPVVAFDAGGLRDTINDGVTGRLVSGRSPANLAEAIVALLQDTTLRRQMGRAGVKWVRDHFEQHHVLEQWIALYRRVAERSTATA